MPAPRKQGTATSLNIGINIATGGYIAIMDADDVALPYRLDEQVDFMERHPEVGLLGGTFVPKCESSPYHAGE